MEFLTRLKSALKVLISVRASSLTDLLKRGHIKIGYSTDASGALFDIRTNEDGLYIEIGDNAIVSGHFVIENSNGGIRIGNDSFIGGGMFVSARGIEIGNDVMISWGCTVMDNDAHSLLWQERKNDVRDWKRGLDEGHTGKYKNWSSVSTAKIIIHDKAWIGFNCVILKGVTIGEGAVVAAGSVVTSDVAPFTLVGGNPARLIKKIE